MLNFEITKRDFKYNDSKNRVGFYTRVSFINTHSSIILFERRTIVFGSMLVSFCLGKTFGKITVARSAAVR